MLQHSAVPTKTACLAWRQLPNGTWEYWSVIREEWVFSGGIPYKLDGDAVVSYNSTWCEPEESHE